MTLGLNGMTDSWDALDEVTRREGITNVLFFGMTADGVIRYSNPPLTPWEVKILLEALLKDQNEQLQILQSGVH